MLGASGRFNKVKRHIENKKHIQFTAAWDVRSVYINLSYCVVFCNRPLSNRSRDLLVDEYNLLFVAADQSYAFLIVKLLVSIYLIEQKQLL